MRDHLPAWIDIQRLAPGQHFSGHIELSRLPDWSAGAGSVALQMDVVQAPSGRIGLVGELSGETEMECQRCLQPMAVTWSSRFEYEVVASEEQAQRLPDTVDPYVAEGGRIQLHALVREESELALPMMARHPEGACAPPGTGTE